MDSSEKLDDLLNRIRGRLFIKEVVKKELEDFADQHYADKVVYQQALEKIVDSSQCEFSGDYDSCQCTYCIARRALNGHSRN